MITKMNVPSRSCQRPWYRLGVPRLQKQYRCKLLTYLRPKACVLMKAINPLPISPPWHYYARKPSLSGDNLRCENNQMSLTIFFNDSDSGPREQPLMYKVVDRDTKCQKQKLVSSHGYSYGIKRRRVNATNWLCTWQPKKKTTLVRELWSKRMGSSSQV